MPRTHRVHRWRNIDRDTRGRRLQCCSYRTCSETRIIDPAKESRRAATILRGAKRIFADMLLGSEQMTLDRTEYTPFANDYGDDEP